MIDKTPAQLIFEQQWQNYAIRALFDHNEEVARDTFCEVWNAAIEEAAMVINEHDHNLVKPVMNLKCKGVC